MNKKGFTLIEVIGVVTVLSIILIVAVPALTKTIKRNEQNKYDEFVSTYETAAENYLVDKFKNGETFEEYMVFSMGELIDAGYIKEILVDPKNNEKITRDYNIKVTQKIDKTYEYKLLRLPFEYEKLEYIESTGTQYIDSGYIPNITTTIKMKLTYGEETAFGSESVDYNTAEDYRGFVIAAHRDTNGYEGDTEYVRYFRHKGTAVINNKSGITEAYEIEMTPTYSVATLSNGSTNKVNYSIEGQSSGYSAYVFARNTAGTATGFSSRKIYYLKNSS